MLAGVLGYPLGHTRSPAMCTAAFREMGLDWRYLALPIRPELFEETVRALPGSGYIGANVTMPHKLAALRLADEASDAAREIGAANTLTFREGSIAVDNTDAGGLLEALDAAGVSVGGMSTLVLGAGGAGAAAAWALSRAAASEVAIWNRTPERASELAARLGLSRADSPGPCDLLVNATSVGMADEPDALERLGLSGMDAPPVVVDLVYSVEHTTPVQAWGEQAGSTVVDGVELLVRQGALSIRAWTGQEAPLDVMREAVMDAH